VRSAHRLFPMVIEARRLAGQAGFAYFAIPVKSIAT
jgi:hypothetical protein